MSRFQPLLSEHGVPISGTGLSGGSMRLANGSPGADRACSWPGDSDIVCRRCTASALLSVASTAPSPYGSAPSLIHEMLPESLPLARGPGIATPASFRPSDIAPGLKPLSSTGITRRLQYYEPLRHPAGPACPSRDSGWCVHTINRRAILTPGCPKLPDHFFLSGVGSVCQRVAANPAGLQAKRPSSGLPSAASTFIMAVSVTAVAAD